MTVEYEILDSPNARSLSSMVNGYMTKGWKLQGGVSVAKAITQSGSTYIIFAQAMIKETLELEDL